MGATFKEDVADIRNSKVADVVNELKAYKVNVDWYDPHADPAEVQHEYGHALTSELRKDYDAVIVAVSHKEFHALDEAYFQDITTDEAILVDVKNLYRNQIKDLRYWSL